MDNSVMDDTTRANILSEEHPRDLLDRAESEGYEQMKARYETAVWISTQAGHTLTLLLAGMGGALAFGLRALQPGASVVDRGVAVLCVYLAVLTVGLIVGCLLVRPMPAARNEPRNWLFAPGTSLEQLRRGELVNLQQRLDEALARNETLARRLNTLRMLAALSPLVLAAAVWLLV